MKKSLLKVFLSVVLVLALCCGFAACGGEQDTEYKVSFNLGTYTGTTAAPADMTVKEGESITLPGTDAKWEGYTFTAWTLDGKEYAVGASYTVTKDVTFTAKWTEANVTPDPTPEQYTVTFNLGEGVEGTAPTAITKKANEKIKLPEVGVTRDGYTFEGWTLPNSTTVYAAGTEYTVTANVTFTAKWKEANVTPTPDDPTPEQYTVTFSLGEGVEGTAPAAMTKKANEDITLPGVGMNRAGYKFDGWMLPNGTVYAAGDIYTVTADVTFTAKWTAQYTVTFSLGEGVEGTAPAAMTKSENEKITLPEVGVTRDGYTFDGWTLPDSDTVYKAGEEYTVTASVTFTAKWTEKTVSDRYDISWLEGTWKYETRKSIGPMTTVTLYQLTFDGTTIELTQTSTQDDGEKPPTVQCPTTVVSGEDFVTVSEKVVTIEDEDGEWTYRITKVNNASLKIENKQNSRDEQWGEQWKAYPSSGVVFTKEGAPTVYDVSWLEGTWKYTNMMTTHELTFDGNAIVLTRTALMGGSELAHDEDFVTVSETVVTFVGKDGTYRLTKESATTIKLETKSSSDGDDAYAPYPAAGAVFAKEVTKYEIPWLEGKWKVEYSTGFTQNVVELTFNGESIKITRTGSGIGASTTTLVETSSITVVSDTVVTFVGKDETTYRVTKATDSTITLESKSSSDEDFKPFPQADLVFTKQED